MTRFKTLFGIEPENIRKTCVITPFLSKNLLSDLNVKDLQKGKLFSAGQSRNFTLVKTPIGAPFAGDCVLWLRETRCENIIFLGSCGSLQTSAVTSQPPEIGDMVVIDKAVNRESFSSLLMNPDQQTTGIFSCDGELFKKFTSLYPSVSVASCITTGSIKLESGFLETDALKLKACVIDLECSAVYAAALHVNIKVLALMYMTDIIGNSQKKEVFADLSNDDQDNIRNAQKRIAEIIVDLSRELNKTM